MDVNLGAALWLTQAVVCRTWNRMAQESSSLCLRVPGIEPTAEYVAFGVSKAALVPLGRSLDVELRPQASE
jgi:hypothetical protein